MAGALCGTNGGESSSKGDHAAYTYDYTAIAWKRLHADDEGAVEVCHGVVATKLRVLGGRARPLLASACLALQVCGSEKAGGVA